LNEETEILEEKALKTVLSQEKHSKESTRLGLLGLMAAVYVRSRL